MTSVPIDASTDVVASLEPIHQAGEELLDGHTSRSPLSIVRGSNLILGRNSFTRIVFDCLSRHVCRVQPLPRAVLMKVLKAQHQLRLNGVHVIEDEVLLRHGDVIALHGDSYKYRLVYLQIPKRKRKHGDRYAVGIEMAASPSPLVESGNQGDENSATPAERVLQKLPSNVREGVKHLEDDLTCPICLEILVKACHMPCGHVFCKACINHEMVDCPTCRQNFGSSTARRPVCQRARKLDSVIAELLHGKKHDGLDEGDINAYFEKTGQSIGGIVIEDQNEAGRKRPRPNEINVDDSVTPSIHAAFQPPAREGDKLENAICID